MGKTYIRCARILPSQRNCRYCNHHSCDLRDETYPFNFGDACMVVNGRLPDDSQEKAEIEHAEDMKDHIQNSMVLGIEGNEA